MQDTVTNRNLPKAVFWATSIVVSAPRLIVSWCMIAKALIGKCERIERLAGATGTTFCALPPQSSNLLEDPTLIVLN